MGNELIKEARMNSVKDVEQECSIGFLLLEVLIRQIESGGVILTNHRNNSLTFELIKLRDDDVGDLSDLERLLFTSKKLLQKILVDMADGSHIVLQLLKNKM